MRVEWLSPSGTLRDTAVVSVATYPVGTTTVRARLRVVDAAGAWDTVGLTTPPLPAPEDPMALGVRIVRADGTALDTVRAGDSLVVCTQAYRLGWPAVVTVPTADRPWCAGAAGTGPLGFATWEQATVDQPGFCAPPAVTDPQIRRGPLGRCASWLVVP